MRAPEAPTHSAPPLSDASPVKFPPCFPPTPDRIRAPKPAKPGLARRLAPLWPYALYAALFAASYGMGLRMTVQPWFFQLLAPEWARERLAESLWYLHSQPPGLNLLYGLALKLAAATRATPEPFMLAFHFGLGFVYVHAVSRLAPRFIPNARVALGVQLYLLTNPVFYHAAFGFFYTFHETVILAALAWSVWAYVERPAARAYIAVCCWAVALVYFRSLFHFGAAIAVLAALAWAGRGTWAFYPGRGARVAAAFGVSAALLLAWPAKNAAIFGVFGYTSWQGYNLSQGLARDDRPKGDPTPERLLGVPAVADEFKEGRSGDRMGEPEGNWNHYGVIGACRKLQADSLAFIRAHPMALVKKAARNYWNFTRYAGRHPHFGGFGEVAIVTRPVEKWMVVYETVFFQDARLSMNLRTWDVRTEVPQFWHISGFFLLFPVILWGSARTIRAGWSGADPIRARAGAFVLGTVAWVFLMCLLVDGNEGNRIRFSTETYVALLAGWLISRGLEARARWLATRRE